ncbi:ABC transporter permease [Ligilactobacillus agilis]|uniref:FtsX-like permease family protein n=1 Tax=Ligilactobacillus agilis TaxID=1601 RepID=UPI001F57D966|nr:ABC transporter permease [Ligilactobacillus agilis]UNL42028.1 ABC transporter permease [Ligilactobacillus agilis]UNL57353.1 ABC transporter permease [Ligilactobacillus agilis]
MLELKLGWQSLRNNKQLYLPFTLATSLLIGVFYIFQAIINNDSLAKIPTASAINSIMQVALVFTSLIIVVFMFYINNIVAKQRNKELGLYSMLGMTKANLFFLVLGVDVCLFGFSLVLGLLIGLSFIKFVLLAFVKLLDLKLVHLTVFSGQALLLTVAFFLAIFMVLLLVDLAKLSQVRPVELWNATKKGERLPKNSWFTKLLGLVGVATLIGGYYLSVITKPNASVITTFFLAIILVVIGTYALFTSASIFFLNLLKQNKNYYYKRNHFITVSGMLYRMKQNGVGLASICLLCTASIVALVATSSLMAGKDNQIKQSAPLDVSITNKKITPATYKKAQELAAKYKVTLINKKSQRISHLAMANIEAGQLKISQDASTANYEVLTLPLADYNRVEGTNYHLKNNELLVYATDKKVKLKQLQIKGKNYRVRMLSEYKYRLGDVATLTGLYLIAPDAKSAQSLLDLPLNETYSFDLRGSNQAKKNYSQAASQQLRGRNAENLVTTKAEITEVMNQFYGGMLFVGLMLSVTMLLTTGMIIYYKQVSEGYADRARFKTMQQVGLSLAETKQAINSQVLMVFMFPIVVAAIHLCFALPALASVLKLFSMYDLKLLLIVAVTMLAILIVIYLLIYSLTTRVYRRIVNAD